MTDYAWYPVTGDGQSQATAYTWNVGTFNWNTGTDWADITTLTSPPTTGTVPGSGTGTSGGAGNDSAYLVAGKVPPGTFSPPFYTPNPSQGKPYINSTNFPVNVLLNNGSVEVATLGLGGYNPAISFGYSNFPTLDIEGAALHVTGNVVGTFTKTFPPPFNTQTATGGGTIDLGTTSMLEVDGTVDSTILVNFRDPNNDTLALAAPNAAAPTAFAGTIQNFVSGDVIDLTSFAYAGGSTATLSGTTLTVNDGSGTVTLTLTGEAAGTTFMASPDTGTGIDVTIAAPCYAAGTRILTARGEVAVEELRVGDRAITAGGTEAAIVWIGDRRVSCSRHPQPELVWPVRIRAGALAECVPSRDLVVSPDHAVYAEGVLIPAKHLVNGTSVVQEKAETVRYFHVELERHDVLLAEGLPAESYLDTGNRAQFGGAAQTSLHADFTALHREGACAPLCVAGPALERLRQRLLARAACLADEADSAHLLVGERRVRPARVKGDALSFVLSPGCRDVQVVLPSDALTVSGVVVNGRAATLDGSRLAPAWLPASGPIVLELLVTARLAGRSLRAA
ncbi:MAG: Hint domain-containing protein [Acidisphaera sp.]|nr:Hint domain-containing protein [Acidisphaera sp.]